MRKKGGKISGRGAYGCVINPPIPCSTASTPNIANKVVKLYAPSINARNMNRINTKFPTEEYKADEILKRIPNALDYFVVPFYHCDISETNVNRHEDSKECAESMRLYPKKLLWMEEASGDLLSDEIRTFSSETLLRAARRILEGIHLLHEHGIIHRDIKANNVLWKHTSDEFWMKLADFGLAMFDPDDFASLRANDLLNIMYTFSYIFTIAHVPKDSPLVLSFFDSLKTAISMNAIMNQYDMILKEFIGGS